MSWIKCPGINGDCVNHIEEGKEELCSICSQTTGSKTPMVFFGIPEKTVKIEKGLVRGGVYGTVAQDIYIDCCRHFGWDIFRKGSFAKQKYLYDEMNVNGIGRLGVWFWAHCKNTTGTVQKEGKWVNEIDESTGGKHLFFYFKNLPLMENDLYRQNRADKRIVFCKNRKGAYVFLGVYEKVDTNYNELKETYTLISENYPSNKIFK